MLTNDSKKKLIEIIKSGKDSVNYSEKQKKDNQKIEEYRKKRRSLDIFKFAIMYMVSLAILGSGGVYLSQYFDHTKEYNQLKKRNQDLECSVAVRSSLNSLDNFIQLLDKNIQMVNINKNLEPFSNYLDQKDVDFAPYDKIPKGSPTYLEIKDNFIQALKINGKSDVNYDKMPLSQLAQLAREENKKQISDLYKKYGKITHIMGPMKAELNKIEEIQKQNENKLMEQNENYKK